MSNFQLLLTIGIPIVLIVLAWVSNNTRLSTLGVDMREIREDMKEFYRTLGRHDEALDSLKGRG